MKRIVILIIILITAKVFSFSQNIDKIIRMEAIQDFPILTRDGQASNRKPYGPFNIEENINALAGDDLNFTFHMAAAEGKFPGESGIYTVSLNTLTERDGECVYNVYVNDIPVGLFQQNPPTNEFMAPATHQWIGVEIPANAKIRVESNNWSNLQRHELNFFEYARGRWTHVDFIQEKRIDKIDKKKSSIGIFEKIESVGYGDSHAKATYNKIEQAYYLTAGQKNSTNNRDDFGYLWKTTNGNFEMEALLTLLDITDSKDRAAGLMIRQTPEADGPYIACAVEGNGQVYLKYRKNPGGALKEIIFKVTVVEMIQIEKKGNTFTVSAAGFGEDYERQTIELAELEGPLMTGFYLGSSNRGEMELARFSKVRLFEDIVGE